jgi:hypothetical protein
VDKFKDFARVLDISLERSPFMARLGAWLAAVGKADTVAVSSDLSPVDPQPLAAPATAAAPQSMPEQGSLFSRWLRKGQSALGLRSG